MIPVPYCSMVPVVRQSCRKRAPRNHENLLTIVVEDPYKGKKKDKARDISYNLKFIDTPAKGFNEVVGVLTIEANKKVDGKLYNIVRYADLDEPFRKKGYGNLLYETALHHLGSIATYFHDASGDAQRVWKSLHRRYKSTEDFFNQILKIHKRKRRSS